jgi:UDP-glucose 4-epimerase
MKILITGKNGYLGRSFYSWVFKNKKNIIIDFVSIRKDEFKKIDFSKYSVIIHLAALVHKKEKRDSSLEYLNVNFYKTMEIANKAIEAKVEQFVYMSTMAVFGKCSRIDESTVINPFSNYGKSKKIAEDYLISKKNNIKVTIIRSPMIYGTNAPGNARMIEKISKVLPIFPSINNKRSFIEINKLCEIIFNVIERKITGIIHPSSPIMSTFDLFQYYRGNKKTHKTSIFNPIILFFMNTSFINKLFGNLYYDFYSNIINF